MRWFFTGICLYGALVLQAGLSAHITAAGLIPDLLLLLAVLTALDREPPAGLLTAAMAGLLADGLSAAPLGTGLLTFTILTGVLQMSLPDDRPLATGWICLAVFIAVVCRDIVETIVMAVAEAASLTTLTFKPLVVVDNWLAIGSRAGLTAGLMFVVLFVGRKAARTTTARRSRGSAEITNRWSMLAD